MGKPSPSFLSRWSRITWKSIWSIKAIITFILSFGLIGIVWWKFFGPEKAWEWALETLISVLAGAIVTVIVVAIIQLFNLRALIRKENNEAGKIIAHQEETKVRVSTWLSQHLARANIGISKAYLFGSITHSDYTTNDVDVVLMFKEMNDRQYIRNERKLIPIKKDFNKTFGKQLHIQRFLASEFSEFRHFVSLQSEPILILGGQQ